VTVLVIPASLVRIAQNFVGFGSFLEFLFSFLVAGVPVRMMLHGKLAIGLLDLILARSSLDAENLVVILLSHSIRHSWVCCLGPREAGKGGELMRQ